MNASRFFIVLALLLCLLPAKAQTAQPLPADDAACFNAIYPYLNGGFHSPEQLALAHHVAQRLEVPELADFADFSMAHGIDRGDAKGKTLMRALLAEAERRCGRNSEAALRMRSILAMVWQDTDREETKKLAREQTACAAKALKEHPKVQALQALQLLAQMDELEATYDEITDSPVYWEKAFQLEQQLDAFCTQWPADSYDTALLLQRMALLKAKNTYNTQYVQHLYAAYFPQGSRMPSETLPSGDVCNSGAYHTACHEMMCRLFGPADVHSLGAELNKLIYQVQTNPATADDVYTSLLNLQREMRQYADPNDLISLYIDQAQWACCVAAHKRLYKLDNYPHLLQCVADYYGADSEAYLNQLQGIYYLLSQCNLEEARKLATEIESLGKRHFANRPQDMLGIYNDLYSLYQAEGDAQALQDFLQKVMDFYDQHHTATWPFVYQARALGNILFFGAGREADGLRVQQQAAADEEALGGAGSPSLPFTLCALAQTAAMHKDNETAVATLHRAIDLANQRNLPTGYMYGAYATMRYWMGQPHEIIKVCQEGIAATRRNGETSWRHYLQLCCGRAMLSATPPQTEAARTYFEESAPYFMAHTAELDLNMFNGFFHMAHYYSDVLHDYDEAGRVLQQGATAYFERTGSYDGLMLDFVSEIFGFYVHYKHDYDAAEKLLEGHVQRIRSNPAYTEHMAVIHFLTQHLELLRIKSPGDWIKRNALAADLMRELNLQALLMPEADVWAKLNLMQPLLPELADRMALLTAMDKALNDPKQMAALTPVTQQTCRNGSAAMREQCKKIIPDFMQQWGDLRQEPDYLQQPAYESLVYLEASFQQYVEGDVQAAIKAIEELTHSTNLGIRREAYLGLSNLYNVIADYEQAYRYAGMAAECLQQDALDAANTIAQRSVANARFVAALRTHRLPEALQSARAFHTLQRALLNENIDLMTAQERELYIDKMGTGGQMLQALLPQMPDTLAAEVYNAQLEDKGLLLRASERIRRAIMQTADATLLAQIDTLNLLRSELQRAQVSIDQQTGVQNVTQEVNDLSFRIAAIERSIYRQVHDHLPPSATTPTWRDVQQRLSADDAAIEFVFSEGLTGALVVRSGAERPRYVPLCNGDSLYTRFEALAALDAPQRAERIYTDDVLHLYDSLWHALLPALHQVRRIYFSPSGFLNLFNLAAMRCPDGRALCEHYEMHQLTSTAWLVQGQSVPSATPASALLVGGVHYSPEQELDERDFRAARAAEEEQRAARAAVGETFGFLPYTCIEVEAVQALLQSQHVATAQCHGAEATESHLRSLLSGSHSVLHLATHGFFIANELEAQGNKYLEQFPLFKDNPMMRAGMALVGANHTWNEGCATSTADGILSASEVATLDLSHTQLAVLSACQTGVGNFSQEGVFGMYRGFKQAGVASIMASMWNVNDESTSCLMQGFYKGWLAGKSLHAAFAEAVQQVRSRYPSPYHWAAFVLIDALP